MIRLDISANLVARGREVHGQDHENRERELTAQIAVQAQMKAGLFRDVPRIYGDIAEYFGL